MKKIKSNNKKQEKAPMKVSTKIFLYSLAGIILLTVVVLMAIESRPSKIMIDNDTDINLEYVKAYFVDMYGRVTEEDMLFENIEAGDKSVLPLEKIDLYNREANLEVRFKFEDHDEMFVDAGYFNDAFNGRISIDFMDMVNDDKLLLKIKASIGLLPSPHISCDEEHIVNLELNEIEE